MFAGIGLVVWAGIYNMHARREAMEKARESHITLVKEGTQPTDSDAMPPELGKDMRGQQVPGFSLKSVDGQKVEFAQFKGKPTIINFWATYCGPCKLEMPWFEEFRKKYAAQGLQVVGIDDEEGVSVEDVTKAAKKAGVTYPILIADSGIEKAYGLGDYLPVTFYVDAKGVVQVQTPGAPSKDQIEANIQKIVGGQ